MTMNKVCPSKNAIEFSHTMAWTKAIITTQAYFEGDTSAEYVRTECRLTGDFSYWNDDMGCVYEVILHDESVVWLSGKCLNPVPQIK